MKIRKTWQTVFFELEDRKGNSASVELELNYEEGTFNLCTEREESVSFKSDNLESAELKLKCIKEALKFVKENL